MLEWTRHRLSGPTTVWCDNNSVVRNSGEGAEWNKMKHMDIKYMFIRDAVRRGLVEVKHIGTSEMIADALTKGLGWIRYEGHVRGMGLMKGSVWDRGSSVPMVSKREAGSKGCENQRIKGLDDLNDEGGGVDAFWCLCDTQVEMAEACPRRRWN